MKKLIVGLLFFGSISHGVGISVKTVTTQQTCIEFHCSRLTGVLCVAAALGVAVVAPHASYELCKEVGLKGCAALYSMAGSWSGYGLQYAPLLSRWAFKANAQQALENKH